MSQKPRKGNGEIKMKSVINGKLYNTATMTTLCSRNAYNNGNYCGDSSIRVTRNGSYCYVVTANGQDLYRESSITAIAKAEIASYIDGWRLGDEDVSALSDHGVLVDA
jgi:hypothetical protein